MEYGDLAFAALMVLLNWTLLRWLREAMRDTEAAEARERRAMDGWTRTQRKWGQALDSYERALDGWQAAEDSLAELKAVRDPATWTN